MTDEGLKLIAGVIFSAGGFYTWARIKISQLEKRLDEKFEQCQADTRHRTEEVMHDLDGFAGRTRTSLETMKAELSSNWRDERRHYHNITMAVVLAAPLEKEEQITALLHEGGGEK